MNITNILTKKQKEAELRLSDDEDFVYLTAQRGTVEWEIANWTSHTVTIAEIRQAADNYLESQRNGVTIERQP